MTVSGHGSERDGSDAANRQESEQEAPRGPMLDPLAMPPEELAKLKAEGYGHLIAKPRRMDDVPGYRRDW